ncbi:hypothetical protein GQ53DRAFT_639573 [Thozetella sp. PMI_491]|nr:hypothetical protein GQ53DRAFT_639573 [Thozetella sp. PMI_491]
MSDEFTERKGGYDRLASLMGEVPDTAIFKKFGALSAEILLYRQAELTLLEDELRDQQKEDRNSPQEVRTLYARSFGKLRNSAASDAGEDDDDNQWNLIQQIEEKLEKYHNGLLLHNRVLKLRRPYKGQLENLKQWMKRPKMGNISILSADRKIWSDSDLQDLVTLKPESVEDGFASSFTLKLVSIYNSLIGRRVHVCPALLPLLVLILTPALETRKERFPPKHNCLPRRGNIPNLEDSCHTRGLPTSCGGYLGP